MKNKKVFSISRVFLAIAHNATIGAIQKIELNYLKNINGKDETNRG